MKLNVNFEASHGVFNPVAVPINKTMLLKKERIDQLERKYRLNLINSLSGIKPANLIGTRSKTDENNLAIFSSVVHLGSDPAQLGMVMRPQTPAIKDTFSNIMETGVYTINHVSHDFVKKAHYTSAKFDKAISEFKRMHLSAQFLEGFHAPFVGESPVKIGMTLVESLKLPNGCIFIIGEIALIDIPKDAVNTLGQLNLEQCEAVGVSGLNNYYRLKHIATFPYVRVNEIPDFLGAEES